MSDFLDTQKLLEELKLREYIAFDLETTGLDPKRNNITEISACRFVNGEFKEEFTSLINPQESIPPFIVELTGITNKMVEEAPTIEEVLPSFLEFIGTTPLVAQNISFDYSFIKNKLEKIGKEFPENPLYDTSTLGRAFLYFINGFSLSALCDHCNIKIKNAHRAGADARATGELFIHLIHEAASKPLSLIQVIDSLIEDRGIYNAALFRNLIKVSVKLNKIGGLTESAYSFSPQNNFFEYEQKRMDSEIPLHPQAWQEEDGAFSQYWERFEKRHSQEKLIGDTYTAFTEEQILVAEAGTGLGKSLAYVSAGYLAGVQREVPIIISTHTKTLQNQLFSKDIPKFAEAVDQPLKSVIYKGKHNYICRTKLNQLLQNHRNLINENEVENLIPLLVWEWESKSGDVSECNGFPMNRFSRLWSLVRSERGYCSGKRCKKYDGCYSGKVRSNLNDADIIIINHSLFGNELMRENSSLPPEFIFVIDEAHHFASVIRDQLVHQFGLKSLDDIFQFFTTTKSNWKVQALGRFGDLSELYRQLAEDGKVIKSEIRDFFNSYVHMREDVLRQSEYNTQKILYQNPRDEFIDTDPSPWDILISLQSFEKDVLKFEKMLTEEKENIPASIQLEFSSISGNLKEGIESLGAALQENSEMVQWSTFQKSEFQNMAFMNSSPLKVNEFINDTLFQHHPSGLFCSATLTINEDFRYFKEKIGLDLAEINQSVIEKIYYSPFHYSDQVKVFLYQSAIDVNDPRFLDDIGKQIESIALKLNRRMLVLCTSYKQTLALKRYLDPKLKRSDCRLFVQNPGISRNVLVRGYLEHSNSILIGTSSFWEGIDFPGDKVELLFIVKTPFDNPFEPLVQAQINDYNQRGDNAFYQYQIPEAAMRFRQGFGRLIRNMNDTGICIVGDTRLATKRYGKTILGALPVDAIPYRQIDTLISESIKFF
ncbi:MAG: helicase C-terminal domain-containing protein [Candidatus Marinimicrobia bacterium]|nr:helicase C-terminal domain-containing protein [Candidatus Neomarinimicrobiota bacterium]